MASGIWSPADSAVGCAPAAAPRRSRRPTVSPLTGAVLQCVAVRCILGRGKNHYKIEFSIQFFDVA